MTILSRLRKNDSGVSPVIAVILMVAITVVLAATVYVWVSGFGSSSTTPAKTVSLTSNGAITMGDYADSDNDGAADGDTASDDAMKRYTVTAAAAGMRYSDLTLTIDGTTLNHIADADCTPDATTLLAAADRWFACAGSTSRATSATVSAGDTVSIVLDETTLSGATLRILDTQANSVILTLVVG